MKDVAWVHGKLVAEHNDCVQTTQAHIQKKRKGHARNKVL